MTCRTDTAIACAIATRWRESAIFVACATRPAPWSDEPMVERLEPDDARYEVVKALRAERDALATENQAMRETAESLFEAVDCGEDPYPALQALRALASLPPVADERTEP